MLGVLSTAACVARNDKGMAYATACSCRLARANYQAVCKEAIEKGSVPPRDINGFVQADICCRLNVTKDGTAGTTSTTSLLLLSHVLESHVDNAAEDVTVP